MKLCFLFLIPQKRKRRKRKKREEGKELQTSKIARNSELKEKRLSFFTLHTGVRGNERHGEEHTDTIPVSHRLAAPELRRSARLPVPPTPAAAALTHEERSARSPPSPAAPCLPQPSETRSVPTGLRRSSRPVPTDSPDSGEGGRDLKASVMTRGTCSSLSTYARPAGQLGAAFSP